MEAEELLKYLKKCTEDLLGDNAKVLITPTKDDPIMLQYNISFIVMEKVEDGLIPRFTVIVKDNLKRNFT